MKDIKKLEKEDFINMAKNDRDLSLEEFKKLKLNDLRKLFNFTHINTETGEKLKAIKGVNCLDCFAFAIHLSDPGFNRINIFVE